MNIHHSNVVRALAIAPFILITILACSDDGADSSSDTSTSQSSESSSEPGSQSTSGINTDSAKSRFEALLDSFITEPNVVNTLVSVSDGTEAGSFTVARGEATPGVPMGSEHQFHIASMTKPFTATVLLQLIEEGNFELDTPLSTVFADMSMADLFPSHDFSLLNPEGVAVADMTVDQLQIFGGQTLGGSITIKHLMQHAHGMPDLAFDEPAGNASLVDLMIAKNIGSSDLNTSNYPAQWSGPLLLEHYLASGLPSQSLFEPGESFHYGETGPTVAGLIIENATGMSLADAFRTRIFDPLGMDDTYLFHYEEPRQSRSAGIAHRFFDLSEEYPSSGNVDVDADNWNTSIGWAGGGLVSTAYDLEQFYRGLFGGQLLQNVSVIGATENRIEESDEDSPHGLGFYVEVNSDDTAILSYRHTGFWGSEMYYFPESGITASFTMNQVNFSRDDEFEALVNSLYLQ